MPKSETVTATPAPDLSAPGPLAGTKVVELASDQGAYAGKLLADMGADVLLVEPPGGHRSRWYGPFADDIEDPEQSLWWWHYQTSKRAITLDLELEADQQRLRELVAEADVFLEAEAPDRLGSLGLDHPDLRAEHPELIHVSITPFGRTGPRRNEQATDLTIMAAGGPVWSCGYDDHELAPVRGGGNQGFHTGCHFAVMSTMVALLARGQNGVGQHIDVNMHAASNVTTEVGSYGWLAANEQVMRQTGRHAARKRTQDTQVQCADGGWVNTGVPPMKGYEFAALIDWIDELGWREDFPEAGVLELGRDYERITVSMIHDDDLAGEIFGSGRKAMVFLAGRLSAYDFFIGTQSRGLPTGIVYAPEEMMSDPHFVERGFPTEVFHEERGRAVTYPGAPIRFTKSPWRIGRRAPKLGEHNADILGT